MNRLGRKRALDKAMDAALKNPNKRRRKMDGIVSHITFNSCLRLRTVCLHFIGPQHCS